MKNLFIDTNVFLSFYHLSNDDLEEIHKLALLIKRKEIKLWLTEQVEDEFSRNREVKVHDAIKKLKEHKIKGAFPQFCKDYDEYEELKELQAVYGKAHSRLLKKITEDALSCKFKADEKINELFDASKRIVTSQEILEFARLRLDVGNPPGKNGSLGDAINWEALILTLPEKEELHFVADDKDYYSVLDENLPKEFLVQEWGHEKESAIIFYRRLSQFFKANYPDIKLASELEKDIDIKALSGSSNFARTHSAIDRLSKFDEFSAIQVKQLIEICIQNDQVNWILSDDDVCAFYKGLVKKYKKIIAEDLLEEIEKLIADCTEE